MLSRWESGIKKLLAEQKAGLGNRQSDQLETSIELQNDVAKLLDCCRCFRSKQCLAILLIHQTRADGHELVNESS